MSTSDPLASSMRLRQRGLTLVELVMFIVVVSVAVAGVLQVLNLTSARSADPQLRKQALSIAEGLLEEIQLARFTYCDASDANVETATAPVIGPTGCASAVEAVGPEAGNSRPFDNVNDYVSAYGTPATFTSDINGNPIAITGGYTANVSITQAGLNGVPANRALRISVTVSYNNGSDSVTLDGYRLQYAPNDVP